MTTRPLRLRTKLAFLIFGSVLPAAVVAQPSALTVPPDQRGDAAMERMGTHDAGNIRTRFWNFGMIGDYPLDPRNVDLHVFHSVEAPTGSGMNNSDGITPFVLARITTAGGGTEYIMETGYRERQAISPLTGRVMRFEPRPGYFQTDPQINTLRSPAVSDDPNTWPPFWPDRLGDPADPGWAGAWNGYFGKGQPADQESFAVMDDQAYDAWDYNPDSRDPTRRGLGLKIEVRSLQWAHPLARDVIFWHYDITNEGTTPYDDNILFGMYVDPSIGGQSLSCDGIFESDDDNAFWDLSRASNLVYAWDRYGHGVDLSGPCGATGFMGFSFLQTPGELGLTGFKMNRIRAGPGNPDPTTDGILFYTDDSNWPQRLWEHFTAPDPAGRFDPALTSLYNLAFLFASGPFKLGPGETRRFSVALAYAPDFDALRQKIADAGMLHRADYGPLRPTVPVAMGFDFTPGSLNLTSHALWITGFLEPPSPFVASDIDVSSILLNDTVPVDPAAPTALGDHDGNGVPDLMVKFNRVAVELTLTEGDHVASVVTGTLRGQTFSGIDYIRVRRAVVTGPQAGSHLAAGAVARVRWETPSEVTAQSMALLESLDGGSTWSLIARGQPNTGSYDWTVPSVHTERAKVAVVLAASSGETGDLVDGVLGVSEEFSIDTPVGVGDGRVVQFALRGVIPNPAQHELRVSFSVADSKTATLALFDVSGRQLGVRRVDGLGPGWHTVTLGARSLPVGLYLIRLTQQGRSLTARAAVVR